MDQREEVDFLLSFLGHHLGSCLYGAQASVRRAGERKLNRSDLDRAQHRIRQAQNVLAAISILHRLAWRRPLTAQPRLLRTQDIAHLLSEIAKIGDGTRLLVKVPQDDMTLQVDEYLIEIALGNLLYDIVPLAIETESIILEYICPADFALLAVVYHGRSLTEAEPINIGGFQMHGPSSFFLSHGSVGISIGAAVAAAHGGSIELGHDNSLSWARLKIPRRTHL